MKRQGLLSLVMACMLAACAGSSAPPLRYYQLRLDPPVGEAVPARTGGSAEGEVWQLMSPIRLPDYLDRDALWLAAGGSALQAFDGHRWAEPLRSAVPRVLAHDLGLLRGADRVWGNGVPAGVMVTRQLRVEVLEFGPAPDGSTVRLRARWALGDPSGVQPARVDEAEVQAPIAGRSADALVEAHRLALWRLAGRMAPP